MQFLKISANYFFSFIKPQHRFYFVAGQSNALYDPASHILFQGLKGDNNNDDEKKKSRSLYSRMIEIANTTISLP